MTEYWKSLPKKMCDACKCWLTDNKASIEFHEKGVRHKQNVEQRIRDAQQKGKNREAAKVASGDDMRRIEAAALRAYEKDLQENPSVVSNYGAIKLPGPASFAAASSSKAKERLTLAAAAPTGSYASLPEIGDTPSKPSRESVKLTLGTERALETISTIQKRLAEDAAGKKWKEARSDDGYSFFYHVDTMDSRLDAPPEGYVSVADQLEAAGDTETDDLSSCLDKRLELGHTRPVQVAVPAMRTKPLRAPLDHPSAAGNWVAVVAEPDALEIDYNTPAKSNTNDFVDELYNKSVEEEQNRMQFKTRTVASLDSVEGVDTAFKKRKIGGDNKRQTKKRDND